MTGKPGPLPGDRGVATTLEGRMPLEEFRRLAGRSGGALSGDERHEAEARLLAPVDDPTPVEGPYRRIAVCGGVYSNHLALARFVDDARRRGAEALYCLGDLGGFGPHPERVWPWLERGGVAVVQGNYEQSLAAGEADCNCGYTDPRDNHFAALSYAYTSERTSPAFRRYMGELPPRRRVRVGERELLLVHGSPRRVNEFLFASTTPPAFCERLCDRERADGFLCTHTGLHWQRRLPSGRLAVNVGALGRPANDGRTEVRYALVDAREDGLHVEHVPLVYDHVRLAREMREERLPEEFVETILGGWWTTCLEILPARERSVSRH